MFTKTKEDRLAYRRIVAPKEAVIVKPKDKDIEAEVFVFERAGAPYAMFFIGTSAKPSWYHRFRNAAEREQKIANAFSSLKKHKERVAEGRAKRNVAPTINVDDIFYTSWGYEQTNIDFYKVTAVKGSMATIVKIDGAIAPSEGYAAMAGKCVANPKSVVPNSEQRVRIAYGNTFKVERHYATKWNGEPLYWSAYH